MPLLYYITLLRAGIEPASLDSKSNAFPFKLTEHFISCGVNRTRTDIFGLQNQYSNQLNYNPFNIHKINIHIYITLRNLVFNN
jgi:hypothetical protein